MTADLFEDAERRMQKAVETLKQDINAIRAGRASAALVERITVDYYGTPTPINQVAVRNIRRDVQDKLRDREKKKELSEDELKRSIERLQKLTDRYIEEMDKVGKAKEMEILEV